jgi:hypothetical protein
MSIMSSFDALRASNLHETNGDRFLRGLRLVVCAREW